MTSRQRPLWWWKPKRCPGLPWKTQVEFDTWLRSNVSHYASNKGITLHGWHIACLFCTNNVEFWKLEFVCGVFLSWRGMWNDVTYLLLGKSAYMLSHQHSNYTRNSNIEWFACTHISHNPDLHRILEHKPSIWPNTGFATTHQKYITGVNLANARFADNLAVTDADCCAKKPIPRQDSLKWR